MIEQQILDLAAVAKHWLMATTWVSRVAEKDLGDHERALLRERAVCDSVIELADPSPHVWVKTSLRKGPFGGTKIDKCQKCQTMRVPGYDEYPCHSPATLDLIQNVFSATRVHVKREGEPEFPDTPEGLRAFLGDFLQFDDEQAALARQVLDRLDGMAGEP